MLEFLYEMEALLNRQREHQNLSLNEAIEEQRRRRKDTKKKKKKKKKKKHKHRKHRRHVSSEDDGLLASLGDSLGSLADKLDTPWGYVLIIGLFIIAFTWIQSNQRIRLEKEREQNEQNEEGNDPERENGANGGINGQIRARQNVTRARQNVTRGFRTPNKRLQRRDGNGDPHGGMHKGFLNRKTPGKSQHGTRKTPGKSQLITEKSPQKRYYIPVKGSELEVVPVKDKETGKQILKFKHATNTENGNKLGDVVKLEDFPSDPTLKKHVLRRVENGITDILDAGAVIAENPMDELENSNNFLKRSVAQSGLSKKYDLYYYKGDKNVEDGNADKKEKQLQKVIQKIVKSKDDEGHDKTRVEYFEDDGKGKKKGKELVNLTKTAKKGEQPPALYLRDKATKEFTVAINPLNGLFLYDLDAKTGTPKPKSTQGKAPVVTTDAIERSTTKKTPAKKTVTPTKKDAKVEKKPGDYNSKKDFTDLNKKYTLFVEDAKGTQTEVKQIWKENKKKDGKGGSEKQVTYVEVQKDKKGNAVVVDMKKTGNKLLLKNKETKKFVAAIEPITGTKIECKLNPETGKQIQEKDAADKTKNATKDKTKQDTVQATEQKTFGGGGGRSGGGGWSGGGYSPPPPPLNPPPGVTEEQKMKQIEAKLKSLLGKSSWDDMEETVKSSGLSDDNRDILYATYPWLRPFGKIKEEWSTWKALSTEYKKNSTLRDVLGEDNLQAILDSGVTLPQEIADALNNEENGSGSHGGRRKDPSQSQEGKFDLNAFWTAYNNQSAASANQEDSVKFNALAEGIKRKNSEVAANARNMSAEEIQLKVIDIDGRIAAENTALNQKKATLEAFIEVAEPKMERTGLKITPTIGDGNCFFECYSIYQLGADQGKGKEAAKQARKDICDLMHNYFSGDDAFSSGERKKWMKRIKFDLLDDEKLLEAWEGDQDKLKSGVREINEPGEVEEKADKLSAFGLLLGLREDVENEEKEFWRRYLFHEHSYMKNVATPNPSYATAMVLRFLSEQKKIIIRVFAPNPLDSNSIEPTSTIPEDGVDSSDYEPKKMDVFLAGQHYELIGGDGGGFDAQVQSFKDARKARLAAKKALAEQPGVKEIEGEIKAKEIEIRDLKDTKRAWERLQKRLREL